MREGRDCCSAGQHTVAEAQTTLAQVVLCSCGKPAKMALRVEAEVEF